MKKTILSPTSHSPVWHYFSIVVVVVVVEEEVVVVVVVVAVVVVVSSNYYDDCDGYNKMMIMEMIVMVEF